MEFEPPEHPANETILPARIANFNEFMFLMVRRNKVLSHARHDETMADVWIANLPPSYKSRSPLVISSGEPVIINR
jgi:hypothetical protein